MDIWKYPRTLRLLFLDFYGGPINECSNVRDIYCHNLNLGLTIKTRVCKVAGQEKKPRSERKCEGMTPHTPKGASTLEVGVSVDSRMFRKRLQGSKPNGLKIYH